MPEESKSQTTHSVSKVPSVETDDTTKGDNDMKQHESFNHMSMDALYSAIEQEKSELGMARSPSKSAQFVVEGDSSQVLHEGTFSKGVRSAAQGTLVHLAVEIALTYKTLEFSILKQDKYTDPIQAMKLATIVVEHIGFDANVLLEKEVQGTFLGKAYQGTADIIELHDDGSATIWDIKNYKAVTENTVEKFWMQTSIYGSLAQQSLEEVKSIRDMKVSLPLSDEVLSWNEWQEREQWDLTGEELDIVLRKM